MGSTDGTEQADPTVAGGAQRFSGRVAVVTGSTADPSIGRSCALRLAREGASVVINGRDQDRVASTEGAFRAEGLDVVGVAGSMDTEPAVALLTDRAMETFGRIDLIVSTVGGAPHPLPFDDISEEQLLETFRLNTWPTLALIRAALARGLGDTAGSVVAISSGSPRKTTSAMVSYASAKAALNAMTRTIAADLAGRGVRRERSEPRVGAPRPPDPSGKPTRVRRRDRRSPWPADRSRGHCRRGVLPLVDDARQITGITLDVDGGNHLQVGGLRSAERGLSVQPRTGTFQRRHDSGADLHDLLAHLFRDMPGAAPKVDGVRTTSRMVATSRSVLTRLIGRDGFIRAERARGVALVDRSLALDQPGVHAADHTRRMSTFEPGPPVPRRPGKPMSLSALTALHQDFSPHRAARTAAATDTAALRRYPGRPAGRAGGVPSGHPAPRRAAWP